MRLFTPIFPATAYGAKSLAKSANREVLSLAIFAYPRLSLLWVAFYLVGLIGAWNAAKDILTGWKFWGKFPLAELTNSYRSNLSFSSNSKFKAFFGTIIFPGGIVLGGKYLAAIFANFWFYFCSSNAFMMVTAMFGCAHQLKVFKPVISLNAILMMDMFVALKNTTKMFSHNVSMFKHGIIDVGMVCKYRISAYIYPYISSIIYKSSTLPTLMFFSFAHVPLRNERKNYNLFIEVYQ